MSTHLTSEELLSIFQSVLYQCRDTAIGELGQLIQNKEKLFTLLESDYDSALIKSIRDRISDNDIEDLGTIAFENIMEMFKNELATVKEAVEIDLAESDLNQPKE